MYAFFLLKSQWPITVDTLLKTSCFDGLFLRFAELIADEI